MEVDQWEETNYDLEDSLKEDPDQNREDNFRRSEDNFRRGEDGDGRADKWDRACPQRPSVSQEEDHAVHGEDWNEDEEGDGLRQGEYFGTRKARSHFGSGAQNATETPSVNPELAAMQEQLASLQKMVELMARPQAPAPQVIHVQQTESETTKKLVETLIGVQREGAQRIKCPIPKLTAKDTDSL